MVKLRSMAAEDVDYLTLSIKVEWVANIGVDSFGFEFVFELRRLQSCIWMVEWSARCIAECNSWESGNPLMKVPVVFQNIPAYREHLECYASCGAVEKSGCWKACRDCVERWVASYIKWAGNKSINTKKGGTSVVLVNSNKSIPTQIINVSWGTSLQHLGLTWALFPIEG